MSWPVISQPRSEVASSRLVRHQGERAHVAAQRALATQHQRQQGGRGERPGPASATPPLAPLLSRTAPSTASDQRARPPAPAPSSKRASSTAASRSAATMPRDERDVRAPDQQPEIEHQPGDAPARRGCSGWSTPTTGSTVLSRSPTDDHAEQAGPEGVEQPRERRLSVGSPARRWSTSVGRPRSGDQREQRAHDRAGRGRATTTACTRTSGTASQQPPDAVVRHGRAPASRGVDRGRSEVDESVARRRPQSWPSSSARGPSGTAAGRWPPATGRSRGSWMASISSSSSSGDSKSTGSSGSCIRTNGPRVVALARSSRRRVSRRRPRSGRRRTSPRTSRPDEAHAACGPGRRRRSRRPRPG